ncbi:MAG: transcriptional repressor LexA [Candidatus Xenobia bacterium]
MTAPARGGRANKALTRRQREILEIIRRFIRSKGFPPSIREIAAHLGVASISTVHSHLLNLEKKGYIRKDPTRRRSIELLKEAHPSRRDVLFFPIIEPGENSGQATGNAATRKEQVTDLFPLSLEFVGCEEAFLWQIQGESMRDAGILHGDLVVAHRQQSAEDGDIIVAMVNEEVTVKRFFRGNGAVRLEPENARMKPIYVKDPCILGKVVAVIRRLL